MNNITCSFMRKQARTALKGKWGNTMLALFLAMVLSNVPSSIPFIGGVWYILFIGVFIYSMYHYSHDIVLGNDKQVSDIFDFSNFGKKCGLFWFIFLFIFLWSLLLLIPGIIASFKYSQSFYILKEHPEWTIRQCVNESKRIMAGKKAKYFLLNLSFIGWAFLTGIISSIASSIIDSAFGIEYVEGTTEVSSIQVNMTFQDLIKDIINQVSDTPLTYAITSSLVLVLIMTPVITYIYTAQGVFYELAKQNTPGYVQTGVTDNDIKIPEEI